MEIAKWIVAVVALYAFGGVVADAMIPSTSRQRHRNPAWPPHAKFHHGQTMLLGVAGGFLSRDILFASDPLTHRLFFPAAAATAMYWVSVALAPRFPGTAWYDPESRIYVLCGLIVIAVILADLSPPDKALPRTPLASPRREASGTNSSLCTPSSHRLHAIDAVKTHQRAGSSTSSGSC